MVLQIHTSEVEVLDLLWIRAAWGLQPRGDVPPGLEVTPEPAPSVQLLRRGKSQWESAWTELWTAVLNHRGRHRASAELEVVQRAASGSVERRELLHTFMGPSWRGRFGDEGFGDDYARWADSLRRVGVREYRLPLRQHPERRCLPAVISAWERGLEQIITVPCVGEYTRTIGDHCLCLTRADRFDVDRYIAALEGFRS